MAVHVTATVRANGASCTASSEPTRTRHAARLGTAPGGAEGMIVLVTGGRHYSDRARVFVEPPPTRVGTRPHRGGHSGGGARRGRAGKGVAGGEDSPRAAGVPHKLPAER
jgi:hypothetical protein